ncbi:MAG: hypothetical protein B7Z53_05110, partial [Rhodospirillales bacterium 12-71-4]
MRRAGGALVAEGEVQHAVQQRGVAALPVRVGREGRRARRAVAQRRRLRLHLGGDGDAQREAGCGGAAGGRRCAAARLGEQRQALFTEAAGQGGGQRVQLRAHAGQDLVAQHHPLADAPAARHVAQRHAVQRQPGQRAGGGAVIGAGRGQRIFQAQRAALRVQRQDGAAAQHQRQPAIAILHRRDVQQFRKPAQRGVALVQRIGAVA